LCHDIKVSFICGLRKRTGDLLILTINVSQQSARNIGDHMHASHRRSFLTIRNRTEVPGEEAFNYIVLLVSDDTIVISRMAPTSAKADVA
jgi:hypothetical protein